VALGGNSSSKAYVYEMKMGFMHGSAEGDQYVGANISSAVDIVHHHNNESNQPQSLLSLDAELRLQASSCAGDVKLALSPEMTSSASRDIRCTRSSHVGMSSISPTVMPALSRFSISIRRSTHDQIPASESPVSYTFLPRAPATSSRKSSNFAPPGLLSSLTTSTETAFLKTRAVFFKVLKG